jgi:argininosuccinate lyase
LLEQAAASADAVMPAYTHLQPAQVTTFGHYLAAFYDVTTRDLRRLLAAFEATNCSPLGAAASSGTSWPLNRERVAGLLGFALVLENTKDAGHNYDWMPEAVAAGAILMNNVARVASDLYIWCTNEFALVELDSAYAAGSSILPQKKNPYPLEMMKARTGEVSAALGTLLEILKGDTGGTAFDIKLTGPRVADNALGRVTDMVLLLTPILRTLHLNRDRMLSMAGDAFTTAVALADRLAQTGLSFRTAHLIVGTLVKTAVERNLGYRDIDRALLNEAARQVAGHDVDIDDAAIQEALDPRGFIKRGSGQGGPSPDEVMKMVADRKARHAESEKRVQSLFAPVDAAEGALKTLVEQLT